MLVSFLNLRFWLPAAMLVFSLPAMGADAALLPQPVPGHPRLLAKPEDWARIRKQVESDPVSRRVYESLRLKADALLDQPPLRRVMVGRRLLGTSRAVLERVSLLAMVARVSGEERYARRAAREMAAAARFADWNPSHFLDTAEMSLALAIGYDWLFESLVREEREEIAAALRQKGIDPSLAKPEPWFLRSKNNWNQVCNAGMSAAAIALADLDPVLAESVLKRSLESLPLAAAAYAPDGAYVEGPSYWNYGTLFHVVLAASLERLTGSAQGTDAFPGFVATPDYIAQMTMPAGRFFTYSDSREGRPLLVPLFWFASHFQRPDWIAAEIQELDRHLDAYDAKPSAPGDYRHLALALLWRDAGGNGAGSKSGSAPLPLHWEGKGEMPLAVHRSAWGDPSALYLAMKGGSPSISHAHMDGGSFVLQSEGVVWAADLGMQGYESLEKLKINLWQGGQEGERWSVFRLGPESHNILRFNGAKQWVQGSGKLLRSSLKQPRPFSIFDLTTLYQDQMESVRRGALFVDNKAVLFQDEWKAGKQPAEVAWQFLTYAEVVPGPDKIRLNQEGKFLDLVLPDSPKVEIDVQETVGLQKDYDDPNPGLRRLRIRLQAPAGEKGVLRVLAVPGSSGGVKAPPLRALQDWN